ncbi:MULTISPECIES: enoyl-CoA hydratase/isomerase family protein [Burkholderia]|uniref:enoyl-CoA hydratase/isomerase family protein n=1 Tax=Burkholderia TaxID=32008 RepID=UPI00158C1DD7|nr:enoyl-CoA hydratase/isomerase family protein [Burkholderia seminalis]
MTSSHLLIDAVGPVLQLTLNRPEKYNAITLAMGDTLFDAVRSFAADPALRVLLIRANGKYFSAGADFTDIAMPDPKGSSSAARTWYRNGRGSFHTMFDEIEALEKPVVIAHHAPCLGGALEMSLSCDFRLAARNARYSLPEIETIATLPGSGGVSRLTRIVGPHWARWLAMAAKPIDAERALAIGLVHEVFEDDAFDAGVMDFCNKLASLPREALALTKLAIELATDLDRQQARNVERLANSMLFVGGEHKEQIAAMRARLTGAKI